MEFKEILDQMQNEENPKSLYDIVSNNYYKMDKEMLKTIIQELDYAMYDILSNGEYEHIKARFYDNIQDIIDDEKRREDEE